MHLELKRTTFTDKSTIGELSIDGKFFYYTLEDCDRGLTDSMSLEEVNKHKEYGVTAIPYGTYPIIVNMSPKFKRLLPRLQNIKGYDGVLIHKGNHAEDTLGCIILGKTKGTDVVYQSTVCENELVALLNGKKDISITISK